MSYYSSDLAGNTEMPPGSLRFQVNPQASTTPGGSVASTLALSLGGVSPSFGTLAAGVAATYTVTTSATVTSTAAQSTLSVADPSAQATGHLVNGAYSLAQPLDAYATDAASAAIVPAPVGSAAAPLTLLTYGAPVSNDAVTIGFSRPSPPPIRCARAPTPRP